MKGTEIKIAGLRDGEHQFHLSLKTDFLELFSRNIFDDPQLEVDVTLLVSETMIRSKVSVSGSVELVCDRSLETFRREVSESATYYFKFGEEEQELSDELEVISKDRLSINFDQLVYDLVALSIPAKRLHPRFETADQEDEAEGTLVYSSNDEQIEDQPTETVDPRWEKLKSLNRQ